MATIVRVYNTTTTTKHSDLEVTIDDDAVGFFKRLAVQAVCLSLCIWCVLWGLRLMRAQYVSPAMPGKLFKRHLWLQHHLQQRSRPGGGSYT
jgi:hypothetical protein